jgi:hypothetical protein
MNTRRSFLKGAGGGLLGLFGFLLPRRLLACHRGRFSRDCVPADEATGDYVKPPMAVAGDFIIDFPDEMVVMGGGGFYTWGTTVSPNVTATGATCGGVTGVSVTVPGGVPGKAWAYRFDNVGPNRTVTLTITGTKTTMGGGSGPAAPGSFTFRTGAS